MKAEEMGSIWKMGSRLSRPSRPLRSRSWEEPEGHQALQALAEVTEAGVAAERVHEGQQRQSGPN